MYAYLYKNINTSLQAFNVTISTSSQIIFAGIAVRTRTLAAIHRIDVTKLSDASPEHKCNLF